MLKVDKLCSLRFIIVIIAFDCNSSYYEHEGSSLITSKLRGFECSVFSSTNTCKSCKIHNLASRFRAQPGVRKVRITKLKINKFLRSYFIFVTYLPREVNERVTSEIYFLDTKLNMRF